MLVLVFAIVLGAHAQCGTHPWIIFSFSTLLGNNVVIPCARLFNTVFGIYLPELLTFLVSSLGQVLTHDIFNVLLVSFIVPVRCRYVGCNDVALNGLVPEDPRSAPR